MIFLTACVFLLRAFFCCVRFSAAAACVLLLLRAFCCCNLPYLLLVFRNIFYPLESMEKMLIKIRFRYFLFSRVDKIADTPPLEIRPRFSLVSSNQCSFEFLQQRLVLGKPGQVAVLMIKV